MIIGRIMSYVGKEYGYINHTKITKIFVAADVCAILTQASGGSMLVRIPLLPRPLPSSLTKLLANSPVQTGI